MNQWDSSILYNQPIRLLECKTIIQWETSTYCLSCDSFSCNSSRWSVGGRSFRFTEWNMFSEKMIITHLRNMSHVLVRSHKCPGFNVYNIHLGFSCKVWAKVKGMWVNPQKVICLLQFIAYPIASLNFGCEAANTMGFKQDTVLAIMEGS